MKIVCKPSRNRVAAGSGHDLRLLVRLVAPPSRDGARPPLCVVPVVDVSGSMGGSKLRSVQRALERLAGQLLPEDQMALVTFDSRVVRQLPLAPVSADRRLEIRRVITSLRPGSQTNLSGGLLEGAKVVREARMPAGMRARIILLTDGLANEGPAVGHEALVGLVRERLGEVSVSAFGYGDDCDQVVLGDIATAGGGSYAYVKSDDMVLTAFARELGGLVATYASGCSVRLAPVAGAVVEETLGDLLYQGEVQTVATIALPRLKAAAGVEVCTVDARWRDAFGAEMTMRATARVDYVSPPEADQVDDPEVARAHDERLLLAAQEVAEARARHNDLEGARQAIREVIDRLVDPALLAFARDSLLPCYQSHHEYTTTSSVRASSLTSLRGVRVLGSDEKVQKTFIRRGTSDEDEMEKAFRKGDEDEPEPPGPPGKKKLVN